MKKHYYYRLYFQVNNQEYSYVGTSINVNRRLNDHFTNLKKVLNFKKDNNLLAQTFFYSVIKKQSLPTTKALYYKLALFMLKHNLTINDLKIEILNTEEKQFSKENDYLAIERTLIQKYHGYRFGFNGLLANYSRFLYHHMDVCDYVYQDLEIACKLIIENDLKKYIDCFWWSFLTLPMVIKTIVDVLNDINKISASLGAKEEISKAKNMQTVAKKSLAKFVAFYTNNHQFIDKQKKFYQDQYQKTKILNQVTF